jgi:hypothetical protein
LREKNRAPDSIDDILGALCELDGGPRHPPGGKPCAFDRSTGVRQFGPSA